MASNTPAIQDNFTGTAGTNIAGRTPDTHDTPGTVWSNNGAEWQGQWKLNGAGNYVTNTTAAGFENVSVITIDPLVASYLVQVTITTGASFNFGLVANWTTNNSQMWWLNSGAANTLQFYLGTYGWQVAGSAITATGVTASSTNVIGLITNGNYMLAVLNGTVVGYYQINNRAYQTATPCGLVSQNALNQYAAFIVNTWPQRMADWMRDSGYLTPTVTSPNSPSP